MLDHVSELRASGAGVRGRRGRGGEGQAVTVPAGRENAATEGGEERVEHRTDDKL